MKQDDFRRTGRSIDDPAARPWLDEACDLAAGFSEEISETGPSEKSLDLAIVFCAAAHIYTTTKGCPRWSKLDVDGWLASLAMSPEMEAVFEAAAVTMQAYVSYLEERALLSEADARRIGDALVPYTRAAWHRVFSGAMTA